ncbi:hypothetical protein ACQ4PT_005636 [Festuca glaucescens]
MSHEMAASLCPSSPAAEPLEIEDLLEKILLRLPPLPSSLPRASAVCNRWLGLVSDPRFVRRFRAHHRHNPPLLGYFSHYRIYLFQPTLEAPNRVPQGRFIYPAGDSFWPLGCRHGLMLILHSSHTQLLVWDPITGDQYRLDTPPGYDTETSLNAAVLRSFGEDHHFQVVLVGNSDIQHSQLVASVYSSETGVWGNFITKPHPPDDPTNDNFDFPGIHHGMPSVMVGDSLYWLFSGNFSLAIIEFDLARQSLALIPLPVDEAVSDSNMWVVPAEAGGLGFLFLAGFCAQFWKRKKDCDGVTSWVLGRSIQLDKLLSLNPKTERPRIVGFAEENNIVFLGTTISVFTIQLESLQFKKLSVPDEGWFLFYPYEVVYTAGKNKPSYLIFSYD